MSTDDTGPLWKSMRPMQFFTLYNFASSTVAPQGGSDSDLERKPPKIQDFACSGPLPRFQVTQEDTRPLWKSMRPMQLFTLYNLVSSTVAPQGGPDSDVKRKPPKIQDFACSGPVPRFSGHPGG